MKKRYILAAFIILGTIGSFLPDKPEPSVNSAKSTTAYKATDLSFAEKRDLLLTYRTADQICSSDGGNCMAWTNLALHCELQLNGQPTDYDKPCSSAESLRERVTGIDLSSAPGAYNF